MPGEEERGFVMRREANRRALERRWMDSLRRERRGGLDHNEAGGLKQKRAEGFEKTVKLKSGVVVIKGTLQLSPPDSMAASSVSRDLGLEEKVSYDR